MACKNFAHLCLVVVLTICYGLTIPLLSVVHSHEPVGIGQEASLRIPGHGTGVSDGQFSCALCFRLNTTSLATPQALILPSTSCNYEVICQELGSRVRSDLSLTSL